MTTEKGMRESKEVAAERLYLKDAGSRKKE